MINNTLIHINQSQLIQQCIQQDRRAQKKLYQMYAHKMYNLAFRIVNDKGMAEDVIQEGFLSVFSSLSSFKSESSLETWIRKIMVFKAINILKNEKKLKFELDKVEIAEEAEEVWEVKNLTIKTIKEGIDSLPLGYKTILNLYLIEGYDHQEISQILNIKEASSRSQFHRGKKILQEFLKGQKWISKNL